jgi:HEAT repeat protein
MSVGGMSVTSPFRGFLPYEESGASVYFGRKFEAEALFEQVLREGARVTALTGEGGVGKTSLLRAGLTPLLARQGIQTLYLSEYAALEREIWQAASRTSADPPTAGEAPVDYLVRVSRSGKAGTVLLLDHLEELFREETAAILAPLGRLLAHVEAAAGPRLRVLLSIESGSFHRLDQLYSATKLCPMPGSWRELDRLSPDQVAEIFEQTGLKTGTFFEAGLAGVIAGDLCRRGSASPLELQLVARAALEQRLTSIRRYERSGGAEVLLPQFFERHVRDAGGPPARRVLLALTEAGESTPEELAGRTQLPRVTVDAALATFVTRGVARKREAARGERFCLAHAALRPHVEAYAALDRARGDSARRVLRRRILAGQRLPLRELVAVRRHLGGALFHDEAIAVRRSFRRSVLHVALGAALVVAMGVAVVLNLRTSFTLGLEPTTEAASARVIVRRGRPDLRFLSFLPGAPGEGLLADTGFAAAGLAPEVSARIAAGKVSGALERDPKAPLPHWLRSALDGLRPVPRGVALVLLGDPGGITSLKQAFADPLSRREALDTLAVIGSGRAGEDEILAAALGDPSPEIRRRGVEVAAAIDRRLGKGSHGTTLRNALGDRSFEVKTAVLREASTLPPDEAAGILGVALADRDAGFRRMAEKGVLELATRSPAAAAAATRPVVQSPDALSRRTGLALLDQIATQAPNEIARTLLDLVSDEKAPEEARVAALVYLRRPGIPLEELRPVLEKAAVGSESSPRLRTAALPLYARLIDPQKALELATAESRGPAAARAAGAAVWGSLAAKQPEAASRALKATLFDPSPEVRIEGARSFGFLRREGIGLVQRALLDPNGEVVRAALDSAVLLSAVQPYAVAEMLNRGFILVRPGLRRPIVEALGRIGQERPAPVVWPLARAFKQGDGKTRAAAATALCSLAAKAPTAVPYLRLAARDPDRDVRAAAASCLSTLGDPRLAAKLAGELVLAEEPSVRAAAAASVGSLAAKASDAVVPALAKALQDTDHGVRGAALASLEAFGHATAASSNGKLAEELEHAAAGVLAQGDIEERRLLVRAAGAGHFLGLLRQAASDVDESVRLEAIKMAGAQGGEGLTILQSAVEDRSSVVRAEAIRRLAAQKGEGSRQALPVFAATLRSGDSAARRASVLALGEMMDTGPETSRILGGVLRARSESLRADATEALGHIAERVPEPATALLEEALRDPAQDVRSAAIRGLGAVWAHTRSPEDLANVLVHSETDSARRLVALEALVRAAESEDRRKAAAAALAQVATSGPPLARLCAQVGQAFLGARPGEMTAFLERLFGG